jgi:activator of Hsp90 ATPase-like protein
MTIVDADRQVVCRHLDATVERVWDLWTTPEGISSWWGPADSKVTVNSMDVRVGGEVLYELAIFDEDKARQLHEMGLQNTVPGHVVFTDVVPHRRLAYKHLNSFFPGVEPYWNEIVVDLHQAPDGLGMIITWSPLHEPIFTQQAALVWVDEMTAFIPLATANP